MMNTDFVAKCAQAKSACLLGADRDPEMTMCAVEKDEDYLPEHKTCVKEKVMEMLAQSNCKISHSLEEGNEDQAIDRGLDGVKLGELREHDYYMWVTLKNEMKEKMGMGLQQDE